MTTHDGWFEIPVTDLEHAAAFYAAILGYALKRADLFGVPYGIFAAEDTGVAGALVQDARRTPAADGAVIYLATVDVDRCLTRAVAAGATIIQPRTEIGTCGVVAQIADPDGNVIGLHAEAR
jgi:predicted enzyme related to lactoylglutathione lyase